MSNYINLDAGAISSKDLRKAKSALNKAISAMTEVDNALSNSWHKYDSAGASAFFTDDIKGKAGSIGSSLKGFKEKLEKYAGLLDSGPEVIIEADRDFKGQKSTAWQRTIIAIGGGIGGLFKHGGSKTGTNTKISRNGIEESIDNSVSEDQTSTEKTVIELCDYDSVKKVEKGKIRWVYQGSSHHSWSNEEELKKRQANGWGSVWWSGTQCNSACESMSLSYMGIDRSPEDMSPSGGPEANDPMGGIEVASYGTEDMVWAAPDGSSILIENHAYCDMSDIDERISAFENDSNRGDVAPVMVRYTNGANGHWIILTGNNSDGTYTAIGPQYGEKGITVRIDQDGNISNVDGSLSHDGGKIERYAQYSRQ